MQIIFIVLLSCLTFVIIMLSDFFLFYLFYLGFKAVVKFMNFVSKYTRLVQM